MPATIKMRIDNDTGYGNLVLGTGGIEVDDGLRTVSEVLVFTDRTADEGDPIPDGSGDPRGFWADALDDEGRKLGSKVWIYTEGAKATPQNRQLAIRAALTAFDPLVRQGVIRRAEVVEQVLRRQDVMAVLIRLHKPRSVSPQWEDFWLDIHFQAA